MGSDYKGDVARKYVIAYKSGALLTHSTKMFLFLKWFVVLREVVFYRREFPSDCLYYLQTQATDMLIRSIASVG
jgi:hypothetical protein